LTHSGRLTHKVVTRQPWIRRRSGKVRRLQTDVLTTEPRRQPAGCEKLTVKEANIIFVRAVVCTSAISTKVHQLTPLPANYRATCCVLRRNERGGDHTNIILAQVRK